jgi:hypothetical protein
MRAQNCKKYKNTLFKRMYLRIPGFPLTVLPNYGVGLFLPAAVIQQCFYIRNQK